MHGDSMTQSSPHPGHCRTGPVLPVPTGKAREKPPAGAGRAQDSPGRSVAGTGSV